MKSDEYVKYLSERMTVYMETPRDLRKTNRIERRAREPWTVRWFGLIPLALGMWLKRR